MQKLSLIHISIKSEFDIFVKGLQNNLNPSVDEGQAIEMLAQHLISQPVFDALLEVYKRQALVRWGKIGLGLYSMRDAVNAYMKACGADKIPFDGINAVSYTHLSAATPIPKPTSPRFSRPSSPKVSTSKRPLPKSTLELPPIPQAK